MPRSRPLQIMITPRARQSARKYTLERPLPSSSPLAISHCHSPRALPFPWPHSPSSHNNRHRYLIVPNRYASRPRLGYTAKLATLRYVMMPDAVGRRTVRTTLSATGSSPSSFSSLALHQNRCPSLHAVLWHSFPQYFAFRHLRHFANSRRTVSLINKETKMRRW